MPSKARIPSTIPATPTRNRLDRLPTPNCSEEAPGELAGDAGILGKHGSTLNQERSAKYDHRYGQYDFAMHTCERQDGENNGRNSADRIGEPAIGGGLGRR
jgi:hypothetical protein